MPEDPEALLSRAAKETRLADQLLRVTFPLAHDPKLLFSASAHCLSALSLSKAAIAAHGQPEDAPETPCDLPFGENAARLSLRLQEVQRAYRASPQAFTRKDRLVIADDGFTRLEQVSQGEIEEALAITKDFVHRAHMHVLFGGVQ